ncbi:MULTISPECIES: sulfite exporter TauE/SafE family protein [unclassified Streptomyces]|uniref:sulfite exporter TauE/SafE family protein n=1 Tax=unclassified Streptomyces TaxID=2593676 RepID=UPI000DBAA60B|nr:MULTISPECIES: sulfite exporter TauE/SafE family protein [unclassified Streptomyces]MYT70963.1 TSUP family transporter [Streptomyces sp. SID8367]
MDFSWTIVVAGALVGLAVGLTGMGGGALMTPIMVMFFGVNPTAAIGSDLATSLFMKPFGAAVHHRAGTIRWDIVRWLLPTALPAAFGGALLLRALGDGDTLQTRVKYVIGGALLLAVAGMLARIWLDRRRGLGSADAETIENAAVRVRPVATLLIGLVGGVVVGMTSVGSGSLIIVMLMLAHPRLRANHLVGTDLVQAVPLVGAAALGHLLVGDVSLGLAGTLLIGAIPGVVAGAVLSTRVSGPALRWALIVLLTGSGLAMWGMSGIPLVLVCLAFAAVGTVVTLRTRRATPARAERTEEREPSPTMTA